jgi:ATP-dependent helicase/nuclease subunit A
VETTIHYYVSQDNSEFGIRNSEFPQETVLPHRERSDNSVSQFRRPVFIAKKTGLTAAERGTALHLAMQYIDFSKCANTNEINESGKIENIANVNMVNEELQRLAKKGLLTEEQAAAVDAQKITRFLESDLGKRVLKAKDVKREFKFSLLCPAEQFYQGGGDDKILLQGVVDCFFEEDDALIVVDFKTDHVARDTLEEKTNHYAPQLATYSDALERITGKHVKDSIIYFFALDEAVTMTIKL